MPTIKLVIDKRYKKDKDGKPSYIAKIRITALAKNKEGKEYYRQEYYSTGKDFTWWEDEKGKEHGEWAVIFSGKKMSKDLAKDKKVIDDKLDKVKEIAEGLKPFSFKKFDEIYNDKEDVFTVQGAFTKYLKKLEKEGRVGTMSSYHCAMVSLNKFRKGLKVADVNSDFLDDYVQWMRTEGGKKNKPATDATIGWYLRGLRAVLYSIKVPESQMPFGKGKYKMPKGKRGNTQTKRALPEETIVLIANYTGPYQKAAHFWTFSYLANGINFTDICRLKFSDINTEEDTISFIRAKTERTTEEEQLIKFDYVPELRKIVEKYGTGGSGDDYIFDVIQKDDTPIEEKRKIQQFIKDTNSGLREIAKELRIKPFSTYSARRSFVQVLVNAELPVATISKLKGDKSIATTEVYIADLNLATIKKAAKNLTFWKDKLKVV